MINLTFLQKLTVISYIIGTGLLMYIFIFKQEKPTVLIKLVTIESVGDSLTKSNVELYLKIIKVKHPDIVLKQSLLETGNYNCVNCSLDYNNLFGFRYNNKYIKFNNWKESCHYYANWQYYKAYNDTTDYYDFLVKVGYATDKTYVTKLKNVKI
jgi:hypothetical protein